MGCLIHAANMFALHLSMMSKEELMGRSHYLVDDLSKAATKPCRLPV